MLFRSNLGLGRRLKNHQREVVRELGGVIIYWTYDPLVARNAHLNFNRLGVYIAEYVDDMYGTTDSVLHGGMATDRFVVAWPTRDEEADTLLAEARRAVDSADCRQAAVATPEWIAGTAGKSILPQHVRIEIPADAETLLATSPRDAIAWRSSVRSAMHWGLSAGYTVNGFYLDDAAERGYYLLTQHGRPWSITPRS